MASDDDKSRSPRSTIVGDAGWWDAVLASEAPEVIDNLWWRRSEAIQVLGTKRFDSDLNTLSNPSDDAALEVCLIRDSHEPACRVKFEVRTNLACFTNEQSTAQVRRLITVIADAQRDLARRAELQFAEPGAAKPYILTAGPRGLMRAYGKGGVSEVFQDAQPLLRAYWLLASVWRAALQGREAVSIARVRRIAEDVNARDNLDLACLFARSEQAPNEKDGRPTLTDELLVRVGRALGCREPADGRYSEPPGGIITRGRPPAGVVRIVAEDLAARRGVDVDTVLRKTLQPMLAGQFNGPMVNLTPAQAKRLRTVVGASPVTQPSDLEK